MAPISSKISEGWAKLVVTRYRMVLLFWILAAVASRLIAPAWQEIAYDGDFEHLPANMPSVEGTRLLDEAFPIERPRSQFMIVLMRDDEKLSDTDLSIGFDLSRRLSHRLGNVYVRRALESGWGGNTPPINEKVRNLIDDAMQAYDRSIELDGEFYDHFQDQIPDGSNPLEEPRMAIAYWDRATLKEAIGKPAEAQQDRETARTLCETIDDLPAVADRSEAPLDAMLDILSWDDRVIGKRLSKPNMRLVMLRLTSEFLATGNIKLLKEIDKIIAAVNAYSLPLAKPGLRFEIAGSAAIGGETLSAARDAIQYTEWFTVILILIILATVYRAPMLVAVPLISIGVAVVCATGLISALASLGKQPGMEWLDLKVFTTSKIFVVVILFGAGTDYCLFLIARLREEAAYRPWAEAVRESVSKVMGALLGSALTTIVGLLMMWVADFGKFHYIGPIIAICLMVGLAVCTTMTPALLYMVGPKVFWPSKPQRAEHNSPFWKFLSLAVTRSPIVTLVAGIGLLMGPAIYGYMHQNDVSYDITTQLNDASRSRQGVEHLAKSFSLGETNPIIVMLVRDEPATDEEQAKRELRNLIAELYKVEGVNGIRYVEDPLGENPPGERRSVFDRGSLISWALKEHRISQNYFTSDEAAFRDRLIRLDVITNDEPYGSVAAETLQQLRAQLDELVSQFTLRVTLPSESSLEDTDLVVEQIRGIVNKLAGETPGSEGSRVAEVATQLGEAGLPWYLSDESGGGDHYGEIMVTVSERSELVAYATELMDALRDGNADLEIKPIEGVSVDMSPSPLANSRVAFAGTTMAIVDLKSVTTTDTSRIKIFVVFAVLAVLFFVLWRIRLSIYLIATVLLSYFATLGMTIAFFRAVYGESFMGLDWKLPLFLFVILVAVGQDYNVYLVTRVLEEQNNGGRLAGLRRAIVRTGGIITSCGVVMAGTFFTMTASAWAPGLLEVLGINGAGDARPIMLRGVVELGFALGLGVLLDTFYVRTILVPAYVAAFDQRVQRKRKR